MTPNKTPASKSPLFNSADVSYLNRSLKDSNTDLSSQQENRNYHSGPETFSYKNDSSSRRLNPKNFDLSMQAPTRYRMLKLKYSRKPNAKNYEAGFLRNYFVSNNPKSIQNDRSSSFAQKRSLNNDEEDLPNLYYCSAIEDDPESQRQTEEDFDYHQKDQKMAQKVVLKPQFVNQREPAVQDSNKKRKAITDKETQKRSSYAKTPERATSEVFIYSHKMNIKNSFKSKQGKEGPRLTYLNSNVPRSSVRTKPKIFEPLRWTKELNELRRSVERHSV